MAREFEETSKHKIDPKKFGDNHESIFGPFRKRFLLNHQESDCLFEVFLSPGEIERYDFTEVDNVTGESRWEEAFLNQPKT